MDGHGSVECTQPRDRWIVNSAQVRQVSDSRISFVCHWHDGDPRSRVPSLLSFGHIFKGLVPSKLFNDLISPRCSTARFLSAPFASNTEPLISVSTPRGGNGFFSAAPHKANAVGHCGDCIGPRVTELCVSKLMHSRIILVPRPCT